MEPATCDVGPPRAWRAVPVGVSTAAIGVLVATVLWSATRSSSTVLIRADVALAVAALTLVPVVARRPEVGGVLASLLVALSPVATPVASFAVLFTARNRPFRQAATLAAVGVAGEAVQALWRPVPSLPYGWRLALMTAAYAALLGWGTWAQARHALLAALRDRAWRAEQEQERRVMEARAAERGRIAREMHDVLAHRLSLLAAAAGAMEYRPDAPPERLSAAAGVIRASAHHALDELREVITLLRSDDAESSADAPPGQTLADLPRLIEEARAAGQQIEVDDPLGPPVEVPPTVGRTAYRIAQEALTNARKHAAGQPVRLALGGTPGSGLSIAVSNPTTSDSGATGDGGAGLIGLAERAALAGGRVTHHVDASGRFHLSAWLPWPT
ncbi:signal transduction histidine kinase [Micromonospora luteifusca]|uniref:histidine kinase n=1 Tax=Micromonospora luteifusca TaxID=709860 RepID=A0ABS2M089_9ACTN|nr:histidine kinase [Micromonospora luteifusca]MBM7493403.1 signal transduction histidine kinase [Micromonospora luteifusca]